MRRPLLAALACAITLSALATGAATAPAADHKPVTITFWSAYTARELKDYQQAFVGFHKKYPWITVKGTGNIQDDKIIAAISGGNAPDALLSFSPNNTGKFCSSGQWTNLNDRIAKDKFDLSQFPKVALSYSGYKGVQCSLPALADAYGLYMNTAMLKAAGYTSAAEDALRADGDGQEADGPQPRRLAQAHRPQPALRPLRDLRRRLAAGLRRALVRRERPAGALQGSALGRHAQVAEVARRLVRLRQAAQVHGRLGRRVRRLQRLRDRPRRDAVRRRVAHGLHQGRAPRAQVLDGAVPGGRRPGRAVRLGLDRRRHRRHPQGLEAPRRGLAADQVPRDGHRRARRPLEPAQEPAHDEGGQLPRRSSRRTRTSRRSSRSSRTPRASSTR